MRRSVIAALIAAASVLGLAACSGPLEISVFSEPQGDDDVLVNDGVLLDYINPESVRHLADAEGFQFFAAISKRGYCLIVVEEVRHGAASSCSPTLPVYHSGMGPSATLVADDYADHDADGWETLTPNLLIQSHDPR
jgi:hypothetical protein